MKERMASMGIVEQVREAVSKGDLAAGESAIRKYREQNGDTPAGLAALSWLARGGLSIHAMDRAQQLADETYRLATGMLGGASPDDHPQLETALGAAIEVQAQVLARRGRRDTAIDCLNGELRRYRDTGLAVRLRKNLNLLTLEGSPAPELVVEEWLGPAPPPLSGLRRKVVLLFFWAHYCEDSREQVTALARLGRELDGRPFSLIGPTRLYGRIEEGQAAGRDDELRHISRIRREYYQPLAAMPVPLSRRSFLEYGVSTTPTLTLVDGSGIVRLYHPGKLSYEELKDRIAAALPG